MKQKDESTKDFAAKQYVYKLPENKETKNPFWHQQQKIAFFASKQNNFE